MTELEKKRMLSKEEYEYLMEYFDYCQPLNKETIKKQTNYYFDTDELSMNLQNITCRIRLKDGQYTGTMKQHFQNTDRSVETEMELYNGIDSNAFTDMGLRLFGEMTTERCVIMDKLGCKVILDKNEYLGYTDYELEIEYDSEKEEDAQIIFNGIDYELMNRKWLLLYKESHAKSKRPQSKSSRFFARYSDILKNRNAGKTELMNSNEEHFGIKECGCPDPDAYLKKYTLN